MTKWYAASVIMYVEFKDKNQDKYPVWENLFLIKADTVDEAFQKAEEIGKFEEGDTDGTFTWDGRPATWFFGGIRKMLKCLDSLGRPGDGEEVSYCQFEVANKKNLDALINGDEVYLKYEK